MAGFLDRVGRALQKLGQSLTTPDDELEEPAHTHSIGDTEPNFPHAEPEPDIFGNHGTDSPGDFPQHWSAPQFKLWEREPQTYRDFYDNDEWKALIQNFDRGWIRKGMDPELREQSRVNFYDLAGMTKSSFDWKAYRAYLAEVGS